jgi:hypothetical protein
MPAQRPLGKHQLPVHRHLEGAAGRFLEFHLQPGKLLLELGGQTGRPGLIASNDAVFDSDLHDHRAVAEKNRLSLEWELNMPR